MLIALAALVAGLAVVAVYGLGAARVDGPGVDVDASPGSVTITDPSGDLHAITTDVPIGEPSYVDVTSLSAAVDGDDLVIVFDLAGSVPAAPLDPMSAEVGYHVHIDTDADEMLDFVVSISSIDDWAPEILVAETGATIRAGSSVVEDRAVTARIPVSVLGSPSVMGIQGAARYEGLTDGMLPLLPTSAHDWVPDVEDPDLLDWSWVTFETLEEVGDPGEGESVAPEDDSTAVTRSMTVEDAPFDLRDITTWEPVEGPPYVDVHLMDATADADDLTIRLHLAAPPPDPATLDPASTEVGYWVEVDTDADEATDYVIGVRSTDHWTVKTLDVEDDAADARGLVLIEDERLTVRVPILVLGTPDVIAVRALAKREEHTDGASPLKPTSAADQVPDAPDPALDWDWITLGG